MAVIQIKDANNKEFSVDDTKIFDFNGDMGEGENRNINDSLRNRVHVQNDVQYVNSKGEVIDANQLLRDSASGKVNIIALDVEYTLVPVKSSCIFEQSFTEFLISISSIIFVNASSLTFAFIV